MFDPMFGVDPITSPLQQVAQGAVGYDTVGADDHELMSLALGIESARRLLDAASSRVLAELDARSATDAHDGMRTPRWLAHHAGLPATVAAARVRVGVKLGTLLPEVGQLLAAGTIGFDHARVLADACNPRIAAEFAPAAAALANNADGVVFERWRREVQAVADLLDQDGGHDPADDLARNRLSKADTIDQTHHLRAQLVGEFGLTVSQTIDEVADELWRQYQRDEDEFPGELRCPSRSTLEALALVEICRRARSVDLGSARGPLTDLTLVVTADEPDTLHAPDGTRLRSSCNRHLLCDPRLLPVVVNSLGVPLDLGRAARYANRAQRRALARRDGGCIFPGCANPPSWCDAHHLDEWRAGGRTDLRRLASLCRYHHMVLHRPGWSLHAEPDGRFWLTTPQGRTSWCQQHHRQPRGPTPSVDPADLVGGRQQE